ncbi:MAG: type II toxin-antitoxin system HicB family antitoxin [Candidatus Vogelbacteria bacterium]|nr:type II toxin-antitoxin system HicB family antitoxin [Candidatus Vogelbacteria bacterium]
MSRNTHFTIEFERETDGRWIAEVQELPGVLCYGQSRGDALAKAEALALRVVADQLETGEKTSEFASVAFGLS